MVGILRRQETGERPERTSPESVQMTYRRIAAKRRARRVLEFSFRIATALAVLILFPDSYHSQSSRPNLKPHQPRDWSDEIVVSNVKDTHSDSSQLRDTDDLYVDFAVLNDGPASVTESFRVELFVDGRLARTFESERSSSSPLMSNYFTSWSDYWIGRLSAGTHTLKIVVDTEDAVSESNERDNEYQQNHYGSARFGFRLLSSDHRGCPTGCRNHHPEPDIHLQRHNKQAQWPHPR